MISRSATLFFALLLALSGAAVHAKVSPVLESQLPSGDQLLQELINAPQGNEICEIDQSRAHSGFGQDQSMNSMIVGGIDDTCPLPAPLPNPFDNVASL